ncbi:hypothetical protein BQ8482_110989 [Mesorhizobium delmotii]|uniref:Uncharacterized protein n=1 Tax=Mesorhizobium delmotii TaxID=1631247 RepID=A0A2P9AD36_9HYPH|nr:hypothetical protein BQ8482_110989 [Mesorhizobium delmotii]
MWSKIPRGVQASPLLASVGRHAASGPADVKVLRKSADKWSIQSPAPAAEYISDRFAASGLRI